MAWSLIRIVLFAGAFLLGMLLTQSGESYPPPQSPVLTESAGASLVVACDEGTVVVGPLHVGQSAIQLQCLESTMVVVRDNTVQQENIPPFNRIQAYIQ
jgi:hypothetical protein